MLKKKLIHASLQSFGQAVTAKMTQLTHGEPEDQLRAPFEQFMTEAARAMGRKVVCTGETPIPDRIGRPDYAVHLNGLLAGYVELKAPGVGANHSRFKGHNLDQWKRFSAIPNILYTDGNEWALYRSGQRVGKILRLTGDVATEGEKAASAKDADMVEPLLHDFLSWEPIIPTDRKGKVDLQRFAALIAPLCRMLRDDVTDALRDPASSLIELAKDWRDLLFPDASDNQFADAYAQTVTFALLLGRSEGADPLTLNSAETALAAQHSLLSRALQVLTDTRIRTEMSASLDLLLRVIAVVPHASLAGPKDPWLYFYEDFLAIYDPKLRKDAGAYYTPVEVVLAQVRLIADLLVNRFGKRYGFADPSVLTLDPATGTGTYLLGVIEHALNLIEIEEGAGAVAGRATQLATNLYGFELMVGPYAVTDLRISRALRDRGADLPEEGTHIYLTDTLESPNATPPRLPAFLQPIAEQHAKALKVKSKVPIIVCLGNPPYDRHQAVDIGGEDNLSRCGGWVRFSDPLRDVKKKDDKGKVRKLKTAKARLAERENRSILRSFIEPAVDAGHGVHIKNLYNLYVYFWRWALWKVFEHETAQGPGIVSYISASSYLDGDAFCGMREHMRRLCDEIWILDLGGEGRGTRKSENVFAIQTPVAIAVAVRSKKVKKSKPAKVHYAPIEGTRGTKLATLAAIGDFDSVKWQDCPDDWQAPFRPAGKGIYFTWPLLTDLMPWQHSGVQLKRTWPIGPDMETLNHRWRELLSATDRSKALRETGDRVVDGTYRVNLTGIDDSTPISKLPHDAPMPGLQRYAYRSFDRQYVIADGRLMSRPRPDLWRAHSERQVYLTSLFSQALGCGPALTSSALIPDMDHFRGSYGAKAAVPLYRSPNTSEANILPGFLELLGKAYKRKQLTPEEFLAYVYGIMAQPGFTARYANELETRELRVPITKDVSLFEKVYEIGARLLWLHTYGERFVPKGKRSGQVPHGKAKCVKAVSYKPEHYPDSFHYNGKTRMLHVGYGVFAPVATDVFGFEVSGLKVVQSWLKYRMKKGAGKKSSPLDDVRPERWTSNFTTELLELLWVLEETISGYPEQERLLHAVTDGECFRADELPAVDEKMRKPSRLKEQSGNLFDEEDDG
ncbi:MAG: N-6 DNA methylase [Candidatus Eisenbacteria bacterium]|uniref:site-specific DNA-methyltransferase (adenine-specific) n=1 Tax=Eiseniibacteriota bacterium TaxID=2212470 RepID=A0A948W5F8_UNCEI|nr:N-6 DNA methylase [Candidatus Eisenbacteria bacterium]MBU1948797.1 N-6 DNA methylase [Candidatus Eisenbacteria bacterium]MBU2689950.1 N-6 DNA methylase [Candidatus Eisenbacteria bacterium]